MSEFQDERDHLLSDLRDSRQALVDVVSSLATEQLAQARRGSWTVARILDHVLRSERLYTQMISVFGGTSVTPPDHPDIAEPADAVSALNASRESFLEAASQVSEGDFYRLQTIGHEEYSVLSILENNAAHDREHAEQIRKTVGS